MKALTLKHINAFTTKPFSGNPAGVVTDAKGLSESRMQLIAREMAMPETAFVLPATVRSADLQIRWFSPAMEIPLCGHATIAAFHALAEESLQGMKQNGSYIFRLQTKSGILNVAVEKKVSGTVVEFQMPLPAFKPIKRLSAKILGSLGIRKSDLHSSLPVVKGNYVYIPLRKLSKLHSLKPDFKVLREECRPLRTIGVSLVTLETMEESSAFHSRFFAPVAGIDEDPVTGSANGPLGVYLYLFALSQGLVFPSFTLQDGRFELVGEQGDVLNRKGRVKIRLDVSGKTVNDMSIAGEAVTLFTTELQW